MTLTREGQLLADCDVEVLFPILTRNRVGPTVEWAVHSIALDSSLKEFSLRTGCLKATYSVRVDCAIVIVGRLQSDEHVALGLVIANARNIAGFFDICACERVK